MDPSEIFDAFPAPSYRGHQEQALRSIQDAFEAGNKVVLVQAPTGSGKSLLARAICGCARSRGQEDKATLTGAYYTTPQVSQLDDVAEDQLLDDFSIVRGKNNYQCILPEERDTAVNHAPCVRKQGYECSVQHRCPYYVDRSGAATGSIAAMTLAYFMRTAGSDVFGPRDICVIDEAHGLGEWAEMYATIELNKDTVPVWDDLSIPDIEGIDSAVNFAAQVINKSQRVLKQLTKSQELSAADIQVRDRLQERISELQWFIQDVENAESTTTWLTSQGDQKTVTIKPLEPARYLNHTVWERAQHFALLSATILNKEAFCRSVGLDSEQVALVEIDHTFPVENRPLYDVTCGKMTRKHRSKTLPKIAETIGKVMTKHADQKGIVHCHAYTIQNQLIDELETLGVGDRLWVHNRDNREDILKTWKQSSGNGVLMSVKMEEALDLEGDLARWQVLCKSPYPNTNDARVEYRLEQDRWAWYFRNTLRTIIQASGRIVRTPDDYGATYVADKSILEVFQRIKADIPPWFQEAIDRIEKPNLPETIKSKSATSVGSESTEMQKQRQGSQNDRSSKQQSDGPLSDVWGS
ncbi:ATP-dependent DNA helicase [Salinarchaeum sp. IM2453]|uniref:helicase C-terminal domain-containing protein n=1 Tax=Salinarchaeum sp. IM2453 TaxID=2862870 RepID=UPI001C82C159|nr:ATP-dependent DNA helicase [Salinarchaeum sp. IM2453]QZA89476.1 ATP-dependent DNA helicase [Salinarchaeum sp. IM2453]